MSNRSIVVEDVVYKWHVSNRSVIVQHPSRGTRWISRGSRQMGYGEVTPRRVAAFIYATFLERPIPPRKPVPVKSAPVVKPIMAPRPSSTQPEVYILQREDHTFPFGEDYYSERFHRIEKTPIAGFHDPALAKLKANEFNGPHAEQLFAITKNWRSLAPDVEKEWFDEQVETGFTLYRAIALPMFETVTTH